jgi:hypothetical protein
MKTISVRTKGGRQFEVKVRNDVAGDVLYLLREAYSTSSAHM